MRSKLLGAPTSIALAGVRTDGLGRYSPLRRNSGTTSFRFEAATNPPRGSPMRRASIPAERFP